MSHGTGRVDWSQRSRWATFPSSLFSETRGTNAVSAEGGPATCSSNALGLCRSGVTASDRVGPCGCVDRYVVLRAPLLYVVPVPVVVSDGANLAVVGE